MIKPHLKFSEGRWWCGGWGTVASGVTIKAAYAYWEYYLLKKACTPKNR